MDNTWLMISWIVSVPAAHLGAIWIKSSHIAAQNNLLDKCRSLYVMGQHALGTGDKDTTQEILRRIRFYERLWRMGVFHGLLAYFDEWTNNPHAIDDCGDRLEGALNAGQDISIVQETTATAPNIGGLTAHEIFGVGPSVTRAQLACIRRQLVRQYHPDRWHNAGEAVRKAAE